MRYCQPLRQMILYAISHLQFVSLVNLGAAESISETSKIFCRWKGRGLHPDKWKDKFNVHSPSDLSCILYVRFFVCSISAVQDKYHCPIFIFFYGFRF